MRNVDVFAPATDPHPDPRADGSSTDRVVFAPVGELDYESVDAFERGLRQAIDSTEASVVLVDFAQVDFLDAHCAGVLMRAREEAHRRDRALCVRGLRGMPARLFELLSLRAILVCPTRETAGGESGE